MFLIYSFFKEILLSIKFFIITLLKFPSKKSRFPFQKNRIDKHLNVIVNGDSLLCSIDALINDVSDSMVSNFFALSEYFVKLKPKYYVIADPLFEHEIKCNDSVLKVINIIKEVNWPLTIFLPQEYYKKGKFVGLITSNHNIKVCLFCSTKSEGFQFLKKYSLDKNFSVPIMQNVLVAGLYLAINLNFREIRVYGADFSWTKSLVVLEDNRFGIVDSHFYDSNKKEQNIFPLHTQFNNLHEYLYALARMFQGCVEVEDYAKRKGVSILNMNPNSFIDAFKKIKVR